MSKAQQTPESFWARVNKSKDCWEWQGSRIRGYGNVAWGGKQKTVYTHRLAAYLSGLIKDLKDRRHVLHKCDNPPCCNPDHLFIGTQKDNNEDMIRKGRLVIPRGENNGHAQLKNEQAEEIRRLAKTRTQRSIAKEFNVSTTIVNKIVLNKTYRKFTCQKI